MVREKFSNAERNRQLSLLDGKTGRYGRLRVRQSVGIDWGSKDKVEFECLDCGTGFEGGWTMQFHNVRYGSGCPTCMVLATVVSDFRSQFPQYLLIPFTPKYGPPSIENISYEIRSPKCILPKTFGWTPPSYSHVSVKKALSQKRLLGKVNLQKCECFLEMINKFSRTFPNGFIQYSGDRKEGSTTLGPFYSIDTGARKLRTAINLDAITATGLLNYCRQEEEDTKLEQRLQLEAKENGAKIIGYEHVENGKFTIRYLSRTGFLRNDTRWRAKETFWGQTHIRRGESLALIVLAELFPANDWVRNTRPPFLRKDNGYKLELDGYSHSQRLALEYQGNHHYKPRSQSYEDKEQYDKVLDNDKLKSHLCNEAKVSLVIVPELKLDPEAFLLNVASAVKKIGLAPTNSSPSLAAIKLRWDEICSNPLADFQVLLVNQLGAHRLIEPDLSAVHKTTVIRYECGNCKKENKVLANGLTSGSPRRYCPQCKGLVEGARKRARTLNRWASEGLPRSFIDSLNSDVGENGYFYRCENGHKTRFQISENAKRHINLGSFHCPGCIAEQKGVEARQVATLNRYLQKLKRDLIILGLRVVKELQYDDSGQMAVEVNCQNGHSFTINRSWVNRIFKNKTLMNKCVVPTACPECCYPGFGHSDFGLLRSTVFHRLYVLGEMYPRVQYLWGFDPMGHRFEYYSCGEVHADGTPHSPIRKSFYGLQVSARKHPYSHLCIACGLEVGQIVGKGKTLDDLVALMKVMREEIGNRVQLPGELSSPTVELVSGNLSENGEVSTTKALLRFWCGVDGHAPIMATKDYYFNRAEARGSGFCPQCVKLSALNKAALPTGKTKGGALRICELRVEK